MKKQLMAAVLSSLFIISCQKEQQYDVIAPDTPKANGIQYHNFVIDGNKVIIKEENGVYYFADDLTISKKQFAYLKDHHNIHSGDGTKARSTVTTTFADLWPDGKVYYTISTEEKKTTILNAMKHIEERTPIRFFERTTQANYVNFANSTGNNSALGMVGGKQTINLYNNSLGITVHEILHALGIMHEQCRPDRGSYVTIHNENIEDANEYNFNIFSDYYGHGPFDFGSVMMYSSPCIFNKWTANDYKA